jgi:cytochrome c-type biogenesis protein CcsB
MRLRGWWGVLLQVLLLGVCGAVLAALAQPDLSAASDPSSVLSSRLVPWVAGMLMLALPLAWLGYRWAWASAAAEMLVLLGSGSAAALALVIPWEMSQVLASGHWGMSNLYEVSVLTLALTGTLALGFDATVGQRRLLPLVSPILAAAGGFSWWLVHIGAATPQELVPALQNSILPLHVLANFIGYGCFAVGAAAGAGVLVRARADAKGVPSRLPTQAQLAQVGYQSIVVGFPMFSLAVLLGCVWAYQAWGGYWSWDPKETWALIVWLVYAAYLHVRLTKRPRLVVQAWWLLIGFMATLMCYIGVNMFLSGLHSYGSLAV